MSTSKHSSLVSFACFKSLNANISDGNFKILLYFWSKVEIKSLIDWEGSLQYSSKSLNFSQLSEISSFCNLRSRKSNYIWNPSSVLKSLIDKSLNASSEDYVHLFQGMIMQ